MFDLFKKKKGNTSGAITEFNTKDSINNDEFTNKSLNEETTRSYVDEISNAQFLLVVEDVFSITGRGTVVVGKVMIGRITLGEKVRLKNVESGEEKEVSITGIEAFRKILQEANEGDNIGILLKEITRADIKRGDILYK